MVLRRKPAPRSQTLDEETPMQSPVDSSVQRYSLSDPPVLPAINSSISSDPHDDDITRAVDRLLGRHPVESQPHRQQASPALRPQSINEPTSIAQPPPVHYNGQGSKPQMAYKPYQPGQYLAPIMTGETLQIDDANTAARSSLYAPSQDPFHDPTTPLASVSELSNEQGYYAPSHDALVGVSEVQIRVKRKGCGVLEEMGCNFFVVDHVFHMISRLVDAKESQAVQDTRVDFLSTIGNDTHDHLRARDIQHSDGRGR